MIVLAVLAGVAAYSYNQGVVQGIAQSGRVPVPGPGPGTGPYPVYPHGYAYGFPYHRGFGFGFGLFGLLWTVLLVLLVFGQLRRLFWRGPAWGGHWEQGVPQRFEE